MSVVLEPLESHEMRWQRRNEMLLTLDRDHRVFFTAKDKGWTLNAYQRREEIEGVTFSARPREPVVGGPQLKQRGTYLVGPVLDATSFPFSDAGPPAIRL